MAEALTAGLELLRGWRRAASLSSGVAKKSPPMFELRFQNRQRAPVALSNPGLTIGSDRISGIVIAEKGVKGFHADLKVDGETLLIEDVGTGVGTFVNGRRIGGAVPLHVGDEIRIADVMLVVAEQRFSEAAEKAQVPDLANSASPDTEALDGDWALRAQSGPLEGKLFPLDRTVKIGRALECEISIPEARLSRRHAELVIEDGRLVVRDLDSSNGTYHNGNRIREAELRHGDLLALDTLSFRVIGPAIEDDETVIGIPPHRIGEDSMQQAVSRAPEQSHPAPSTTQNFPLWGMILLGLIAIAGGVYYYLNF
jgi:pSer/pThr/pTyr-binding forkhead associated (FHA) protein